MIQKTYSEGIFLEHEGPVTSRSYQSSYTSASEQSYITGVTLEPRLVPKRTIFTRPKSPSVLPKSPSVFNRSCSLTNGFKSYSSAVSIQDSFDEGDNSRLDCDYPYSQNIEVEPQLVPMDYSETVHNFPREDTQWYTSTLKYDPCHIKENYLVGLRVDKLKEVVLSSGEVDSSFTASTHLKVCCESDQLPPVDDEPDYVNIIKGGFANLRNARTQ